MIPYGYHEITHTYLGDILAVLQLDKIQNIHPQVFEALRHECIGVNLNYISIHTHQHYEKIGFRVGDFLEAERYCLEAISLPIYQNLTNENQNLVVDALRKILMV